MVDDLKDKWRPPKIVILRPLDYARGRLRPKNLLFASYEKQILRVAPSERHLILKWTLDAVYFAAAGRNQNGKNIRADVAIVAE